LLYGTAMEKCLLTVIHATQLVTNLAALRHAVSYGGASSARGACGEHSAAPPWLGLFGKARALV